MIRLQDLIKTVKFTDVALCLANKIAFNQNKAFSAWDQNYFEFARKIEDHLRFLEHNIEHYRFKPAILVEKKVKFKTRKLYISDWRDKIVEMWLNRGLNQLLVHKFSPSSYAFRPDKSVISCQSDAQRALTQSSFFLKRDIKDFYYTIDHQKMLEVLATFVCQEDPLYDILSQRISFRYYKDRKVYKCDVGLPFGSAVACSLANMFLHDVDLKMQEHQVLYHRYADDFLVAGYDASMTLHAGSHLDDLIAEKKLRFSDRKSVNVSFDDADGFAKVNRIAFLGIEYWENGVARLPIEKRRKIINIVKNLIDSSRTTLKRIKSPRGRAAYLSKVITQQLKSRIRNAAIIDYFMTSINDEEQLSSIDRQIAEIIIAASTGKKFRKGHFRIVPYEFLRRCGLISLLHRSRLLRSREVKFEFLSLFNRLSVEKIIRKIELRKKRIDDIKLIKMLRKDT